MKCEFVVEKENWSGCYRGEIDEYCNVFSTGLRDAWGWNRCKGKVEKCTRQKARLRKLHKQNMENC